MRLANRPRGLDHYQFRIRHTPAERCAALMSSRRFHDQVWASVPTFGCGLPPCGDLYPRLDLLMPVSGRYVTAGFAARALAMIVH